MVEFQPADHATYNAFVQRVQEEAAAFGIETKVVGDTDPEGRIHASFSAFWEDWHQLGYENNAMTPDASRAINPDGWLSIVCRATDELAKS